ncbi:MAG: arsenosugar biosynthesis radical SAM protein ArsS [Myxococcales bacterium]|nr:arsenosugar biosynthesis radical SAM protein ArsS [Myxococcales bacterium]
MRARGDALASPAVQRETLRGVPLDVEFHELLSGAGLHPLRSRPIEVLQINLGRVCNQTCHHCHVDAGPDRREQMDRETLEYCLSALERSSATTVDITGGAPEMHPDFRWFVREVVARGRHVMDRCNLTILETPSHRDLPHFLADHRVELVCSLPHYRAPFTDRQRGDGVYETSIRALKHLNEVGYGRGGDLRLNLVTNPVGAFLPGNQRALEVEWKRELLRLHGISFDSLYTITNLPISRFLEWLRSSGNLEGYMTKLRNAFNPQAAAGVMCRTTLSVAWDGTLHDCDFNQMLELPLERGAPQHIRDFDGEALESRRIRVGRHCLGCTAGAGSSCGGSIA